jgi:CBS domain-containing protein
MQISDVLKIKGTHVTTVLDTDTIEHALHLLAEHRVGALVVENAKGTLTGIFSERDLVTSLARRGADILRLHVSELMSTTVITCAPTDRIDAALAKMTLSRIRHLPVLTDGHLAGIVSIGDLVHYRLSEKELEAGVLLDIARMRG